MRLTGLKSVERHTSWKYDMCGTAGLNRGWGRVGGWGVGEGKGDCCVVNIH